MKASKTPSNSLSAPWQSSQNYLVIRGYNAWEFPGGEPGKLPSLSERCTAYRFMCGREVGARALDPDKRCRRPAVKAIRRRLRSIE